MLLYKNSRIIWDIFPNSQIILAILLIIGLFSCKEVAKVNEVNSKVQVANGSDKSELVKPSNTKKDIAEKIESLEEGPNLDSSITKINANQKFIRESNESAETFVLRIQNELINGEEPFPFNHEVIETETWLENSNTIIVFFEKNEEAEDIVEGYLLISRDKKHYEPVLIQEYEPEGNMAQILSVFFANADQDSEKEFIVLCSWNQSIKGTIEGKLYKTYIYDNVDFNNIPEQLVYLQEASNHFSLEFDGIQEGEKRTAKYKTAESIKKKLMKIGDNLHKQ